MKMTFEAHPLANIFPMIDDEAFPSFKADIETNGLLEPIIMLDGMILDGRNRHKAVMEIGDRGLLSWVEWGAYCKENSLDITPLDYVISKNMARRHLTESQRSMSAARATTMKQGERTDLKKGPLDNTEPSANLRNVSAGDAANMFKVSERSVSSANRVINDGVERLKELVDQGKVVVSVAEELARLAKGEQEKILAENEVSKLKSIAKRSEVLRKRPPVSDADQSLPLGRYSVIYCDPPWSFDVWSGAGTDRSAENHYPTMTLEQMQAMDVGSIADVDCVLLMWAVMPQLQEALDLIRAWGFEYKTVAFNWVKTNKKNDKPFMGMGYWTRANSEICLLAVKGSPKRVSASVSQVVITPRREHSRKPDEVYGLIEELLPGPYVELFARTQRDGWGAWGNQSNRFDDVGVSDRNSFDELPPRKVSTDEEIRDRLDARRLKAVEKEWPPQDVRYDGKHTDETDRVIEMGYALKKPITAICDALGIDRKQKGIIKGRASRAGWTDPARMAWRGKAKK